MRTKAQLAKAAKAVEENVQQPEESIVSETVKDSDEAKKELSPSEVKDALEAEAADSKPAPEVSIDYDYQQGLRARVAIPEALDKKNPAWVHVWQPEGIEPQLLKSKRMEAVLKDGELIRDGGDFLCRLPREFFNRKRGQERAQSEASIAGIVPKGQEHKFKRKRTPKSASGE